MHRDHSSSVTVLTGARAQTMESSSGLCCCRCLPTRERLQWFDGPSKKQVFGPTFLWPAPDAATKMQVPGNISRNGATTQRKLS